MTTSIVYINANAQCSKDFAKESIESLQKEINFGKEYFIKELRFIIEKHSDEKVFSEKILKDIIPFEEDQLG